MLKFNGPGYHQEEFLQFMGTKKTDLAAMMEKPVAYIPEPETDNRLLVAPDESSSMKS